MKALILALLFLAGCTLPQVIYIQQPSEPADAAYWNMPYSQRWVTDPPVKIPQWCRDPISHTVVPC